METILGTAFGRVIEVQKGESSVLTEAAVIFFDSIKEDRIDYAIMILSKLKVYVIHACLYVS